MTYAQSKDAQKAYTLVNELQNYFVKALNHLSKTLGKHQSFESLEWLRNGGGLRYEARDNALFNRGSINVSHVHYDNDENKNLASASAISTIIHPKHPLVPSMHMHISWTEMKNGEGYWRMMADLNPAITQQKDKEKFLNMLHNIAPAFYQEGSEQGDKYFYIPALKRHRGVAHYYLENFNTNNKEADQSLAKKFGTSVIECYVKIIKDAIINASEPTKEEQEKQLSYHTLYLLQVLTLDRGTTSGLLIHDENDIGIMGSIPSHVNPKLLRDWIEKMEKPQDQLLRKIIGIFENKVPSLVDVAKKKALASVVREHYKKYPKALKLQASGNTVPPTVENHK